MADFAHPITPSTSFVRYVQSNGGANDYQIRGGSAVVRSDGTVLVCWSESLNTANTQTLWLGVAPSVFDFLTVTDSVVPITSLIASTHVLGVRASSGVWGSICHGPDGDIWLVANNSSSAANLVWDGSIQQPTVGHPWGSHSWKSSDEGATWDYVSEMPWSLSNLETLQNESGLGEDCIPGDILEMPSGRWVVMNGVWSNFFIANNVPAGGIFVSDNQGASWSLQYTYGSFNGGSLQRQFSRFNGEIKGGQMSGGGPGFPTGFLESNNNGTSFSLWQAMPLGGGCQFEGAGSINTLNNESQMALSLSSGSGVELWTASQQDPLTPCGAIVANNWTLQATYTSTAGQHLLDRRTIWQPLGAGYAALIRNNGVVPFTTLTPGVSVSYDCDPGGSS